MGGTSAHQYHGLTPICSLTSYKPNIVPLLSDPAITSADSIPGMGCGTSWEEKDSHCPWILDISIFPFLTRVSIKDDFPIVPAIIAGAFVVVVVVLETSTVPLIPKTRPKSVARS